MPILKIELPLFTCTRCPHRWWPKDNPEITPKRCPACKSSYWNKERVRNLTLKT